jgi:hypothetical protein
VVVSLNLLDPLLDAMEGPQAQPLVRTRREGVELFNPHPESLAGNDLSAGLYDLAVAAREVGAVVVIFDEDRDNRYPYTTTWWGWAWDAPSTAASS